VQSLVSCFIVAKSFYDSMIHSFRNMETAGKIFLPSPFFYLTDSTTR
jgi:hypothetical protein